MATPELRFMVRKDNAGHWMVWDRQQMRPAELNMKKMVGLSLSAAETLRDTLNADHPF